MQGADRHVLNRHNIEMVECAKCNRAQPVAHKCRWCHTRFGKYTCLICNFFDHDSAKRQFHCHACGICRVGGQENFFHCDTCSCCYDVALKVCAWESVGIFECSCTSAACTVWADVLNADQSPSVIIMYARFLKRWRNQCNACLVAGQPSMRRE